MIKTIDFAGIELDNYTVREMIMNVEKDMSDHCLLYTSDAADE